MIGVFDSGLGGLSVLSAIAKALPSAELAYLADSAYLPYGNKSDSFIQSRVLNIGHFLVAQGCTLLVLACNTATAAAGNALRQALPHIPLVAIEPGIKPAAAASRSGHIAVLATESTARSERLAHLIRTHAQHVHVHIEACPGWATHIETLDLQNPKLINSLHKKIGPLLKQCVDQIVLGCTHYSFLSSTLEPMLDKQAVLVDVAAAVARQCQRIYVPQRIPDPHSALVLNTYTPLHLYATAQPTRLTAALPLLGLHNLSRRIEGTAKIVDI